MKRRFMDALHMSETSVANSPSLVGQAPMGQFTLASVPDVSSLRRKRLHRNCQSRGKCFGCGSDHRQSIEGLAQAGDGNEATGGAAVELVEDDLERGSFVRERLGGVVGFGLPVDVVGVVTRGDAAIAFDTTAVLWRFGFGEA